MNTIKRILRSPLFLLTIPLFIVIHIEQENPHLIRYPFIISNLLKLFIPPVVVMLVALLIFRNRNRAAVFSCVVLLINYFFGEVKIGLRHWYPQSFVNSYSFLLPLAIAAIVFTLIYLIKKKPDLTRVITYINLVFLLFIVADVLQIFAVDPIRTKDPGDHAKPIARNYVPCDTCQKPDIYYFIFDAYTASATLQQDFHYTNPIDTQLRNIGFFPVIHSRSNYNLTPFSISSTLNMNYLPHVDPTKEFYMNEFLPGLYGVYKNELTTVLDKEGYEIINNSIFDIEHHPTTTTPYDLWRMDLLYDKMNIWFHLKTDIGWWLNKKLHIPLESEFNFELSAKEKDRHLTRIRETLLESIHSTNKQPRFVYTHFVLPHAIYSLDSNGNSSSQYLHFLDAAAEKQAYVEQVKYSNKLILSISQTILQQKDRPAVIIIQGDHSHRIAPQGQDRTRNQFTNFNAIYLPGQQYSLLNDSITNVNTFRIVLNTLFHKQYPLLKDTSYFLNYK